jgi:branched-chain amino acid aminotransferase
MFDNSHFPKAKKYWYMGSFHDWSKPQIHPMSHALNYGTSVFEGIRAYKTLDGPAVFRLPEHLDRFFWSASVLRMTPPYSKDEITAAIIGTLKENKLESAYIRPLLIHSYGNLGLVPKHSPVELIIGAWVHHSQFDMKAKLGGLYVLSTLAGNLAREQGYDEAVYLNLEGKIAEGPGENIFIIKNKVLKTNDTSDSILEGITRTSVLEIAKGLGIKTLVGSISKEEFIYADEAFFTGTAVEIAPIIRIADNSNSKKQKREYSIGSGQAGEITKLIIKAYRDAVEGKNNAYEKWLTYVHER